MAKQNRFVKGNTTEDKLNAIEKTFQHFLPRLQQTVITPVVPITLSHYCAEMYADGRLIKFLTPTKLTVQSLSLYLDSEFKGASATLVVKIVEKSQTVTRELQVKAGTASFTFSEELEADTLLDVSLTYELVDRKGNAVDAPKDAVVSITYLPSDQKQQIASFLTDTLLGGLEE